MELPPRLDDEMLPATFVDDDELVLTVLVTDDVEGVLPEDAIVLLPPEDVLVLVTERPLPATDLPDDDASCLLTERPVP